MEQLYPSQSQPVCNGNSLRRAVIASKSRADASTSSPTKSTSSSEKSISAIETRRRDPGIRLLAEHKSDIMQHMNADHKDALILLAKRFAGIEAQEAEMTSVDRLGFNLRLKTQDGVHGARIAFLREVAIRHRPEKCSSRW